jgi:hypothetical protein
MNGFWKIQVAAKGLPWADLERMPDFENDVDAEAWLVDNGAVKLEQFGLSFRVVVKDVSRDERQEDFGDT